jgi:hypothetical protein
MGLAIVATAVASIVNTAVRARYGVRRGGGRQGPGEAETIALLTNENEALKGQLTRLEERISVLERIATDRRTRLSEEIETLR